MSCSGIVTGIYTTSSPEACQYIAHDCRANIIVVDTQKQLEKILKVWEKGQWSRGSELTKDSPTLPAGVPVILHGDRPHHTHTEGKAGQWPPTICQA